uniref:Uncharacterized protein n=1 Tax=Buteo japonicus TaxID=224669 RepID=A0A8C0B9Q5_9AVES
RAPQQPWQPGNHSDVFSLHPPQGFALLSSPGLSPRAIRSTQGCPLHPGLSAPPRAVRSTQGCPLHPGLSAPPRAVRSTQGCPLHPGLSAPPRAVRSTQGCPLHPGLSAPPRAVRSTQGCPLHPGLSAPPRAVRSTQGCPLHPGLSAPPRAVRSTQGCPAPAPLPQINPSFGSPWYKHGGVRIVLIPRARGPILHPPANPLGSGGSQGHPVLLQGMGQLCRRTMSPGRGWEVSPPSPLQGNGSHRCHKKPVLSKRL